MNSSHEHCLFDQHIWIHFSLSLHRSFEINPSFDLGSFNNVSSIPPNSFKSLMQSWNNPNCFHSELKSTFFEVLCKLNGMFYTYICIGIIMRINSGWTNHPILPECRINSELNRISRQEWREPTCIFDIFGSHWAEPDRNHVKHIQR